MDFRQYVRERLSPLALAREPEIVDELAEHLSDLYEEARTAGASHEHALARAAAAIPGDDAALARHIESAAVPCRRSSSIAGTPRIPSR